MPHCVVVGDEAVSLRGFRAKTMGLRARRVGVPAIPRSWPRFAAALAVVLLAVAALARGAEQTLDVGKFSAAREDGPLPAGWRALEFKKIPHHTVYRLVRDGEAVVVEAKSESSASGLVRPIRIDAKECPIVEWRWKVMNLIAKADVRRKSGDDYPARIYITFECDPARLGFLERLKFEAAKIVYGQYPPIAALDYIWEARLAPGSIVPNPYSSRVQMIVVESGPERLGRWIDERRDVVADYHQAFGEDPPPISGLAIMTDSDNTGKSATAYYGDIVFQRK